MPSLDWNKFDNLPGSRSQNFENLCRALVRIHFGSFGQFRALRNQPGVEFHLKLSRECSNLGNPPRWYGWQCKLHELTSAGHLRAASKTDIEDSLRKTEEHLPHVTDWVLWTPHTLSKRDQAWFNGLETNLALQLWSEEELDTYLSGPGLILRSSYFGDLIATPHELAQRHFEAVQPIRERWLEPVHQSTEAERTIRRMLGEPGSWDHLIEVGESIRNAAKKISEFTETAEDFPEGVVTHFVDVSRAVADTLLSFRDVLADGDLVIIQQKLSERQSLIDDEIKSVPRLLRRLNVPIALDATNALNDLRIAQGLLDEIDELLGVGIVALLADAGGGKTQLAAEVTSVQPNRSAGVLLHGRNLHRGQGLDDLAQRISLNGSPLQSFEQLLASLDAAAKRDRCRLPLVIDGLNEAENPKDWKAPLASLCATVKGYPNVLVVCTLRTGERPRNHSEWEPEPQTSARESFAVMSLPDDLRRIESEGFGGDVDEAIEKYFDYFKIEPGDAEIPIEFLQHPLTLRIFCQVTNPDRESVVNIDFFPASLAPIFEKFVESAAHRISDFPNLSHSYRSEEVHAAVQQLGTMLWEGGKREISENPFRDFIADSARPWDSSIVNLLTQEGLIFRDPGNTPHEYKITAAYDALGGFLIANALLTTHASDRSFDWLNDPNTINSLSGDGSHELAADIFRALVSLTPRRMPGKQLWTVTPPGFRNAALRFSTLLDADSLDQETVDALRELFNDEPKERQRLYKRLYATRAAVDHPLNADFLDEILRPMVTAAERDLSWTEWIRTNREERFSDILAVEERWKSSTTERTVSDRLRARWIMWHLTSTDRELRDVATRALYWFGRGDPSALFKETISSLDISDPYVPERMLAASYGVAMALHGGLEDPSFSSDILPEFARSVFDSMFSDGARHRITHVLLREYALRTIEVAALHNPSLFSPEELARTKPPFSVEGLPPWGEKDKIESEPSPFRMDFENYTLGRLIPDRGNYDYDHEGYKKTKARIRWRIEQLGWSGERFEEIDRRIAMDLRWPRPNNDSMKTDRYGKKYSWIAYFEMSGLLQDQGAIDRIGYRGRTSDVDIDPSFPERVLKTRLIDADILGHPEMKMKDWIAKGEQPDMAPYLQVPRVGTHQGPWIALDGSVVQEDETRGRRSFCFVRSFIVKNSEANGFFEHMSEQELEGRWLVEKPSVIYTFSGEIPWCGTYPPNNPTEVSFVVSERRVKVERTREKFFMNDKELNISEHRPLLRKLYERLTSSSNEHELSEEDLEKIEVRKIPVEEEVIEQELAKFEVLIPVCDFGWEGHQTAASNPGHAVTLAREIASDLDLTNRAQEFDLFTKDGTRASLGVSDLSEDYNNDQTLLFMREDLLKSYLKKHNSVLIWAIWGEREYSSKQAAALFHGPNHPDQTHGNIREVKRYEW